MTGVNEFENAFHRPRRDVLNADVAFGRFAKIVGEHRAKVGRGSGENQSMTGERNAVDVNRHVGEQIGQAKLIDGGK